MKNNKFNKLAISLCLSIFVTSCMPVGGQTPLQISALSNSNLDSTANKKPVGDSQVTTNTSLPSSQTPTTGLTVPATLASGLNNVLSPVASVIPSIAASLAVGLGTTNTTTTTTNTGSNSSNNGNNGNSTPAPTPTATTTAVGATPVPTPTATATAIGATPIPTPTATATDVGATPMPTPTATATSISSTPVPTPTATATATINVQIPLVNLQANLNGLTGIVTTATAAANIVLNPNDLTAKVSVNLNNSGILSTIPVKVPLIDGVLNGLTKTILKPTTDSLLSISITTADGTKICDLPSASGGSFTNHLITLSANQTDQLKNSLLYISINSTLFPSGLIRGKLTVL